MKPILKVLQGESVFPPPVWMMRQAGRYLPEYRELRGRAGGFLEMVYDPDLACEITMQPIRRYRMDGAILFSDILIIPHALGRKLEFVPGTGPVLEAVRSSDDLQKLSAAPDLSKFDSVARTVGAVREALSREGYDATAMIGFAGAPWTVACYMVEGGGSKEFLSVKAAAADNGGWFDDLIDRIEDATITYLDRQVRAGAELLQLFDSWAGLLDDALFEKYVIRPTGRIVSALKNQHPDIPVIGFPRGAGFLTRDYAQATGVDALGLDSSVPLTTARDLQTILPVQGNLDPAYLLGEEKTCLTRTGEIVEALSGGPHIFNLGHGVNKHTDPERVRRVIDTVRKKPGS